MFLHFSLVLLCPCWILYRWCYSNLNASVVCWTCIHPYVIVLYWLHVQMIICFAIWSLWSFPYNCHMFHNMFTWSHFTCYIILVILSLDLPWGSNVFCASVLGYKYICSKFITTSRFRCEWVLPLFSNSHLSLESVLGFCHGIAKVGDWKVEFIQPCVGFIPYQICL